MKYGEFTSYERGSHCDRNEAISLLKERLPRIFQVLAMTRQLINPFVFMRSKGETP
jgi:hypothetical protein